MSGGGAPAPPPGGAGWSAVNSLFHRAIALAPESRAAFLDEACRGNAALRLEVESLVAAHERAGATLLSPVPGARDLLALLEDAGSGAAGRVIGQYRIRGVLGEGGMGIVYLAEDQRLGRTVALKALAPRFTRDEARRERLRREARTLAALSHPGIATVYALEEFGEDLYIASEYVPGETLRDEVGRGAQPVRRVLDTALDLARALAAAHDRGVIHRDLKPENIIRTPGGGPKILDFGLARLAAEIHAGPALTEDGTVLGTPAYMSPEQIRGEPVDARSDLFSLGIVLYELATGRHPFAGSDPASTIARILEREPEPLAAAPAASSGSRDAGLDWLDDVVATCLRKDAGARYASAWALVAAIERAGEAVRTRLAFDPARDGRPASARTHPRWWWRFHQAAVAAAYAGLLVPVWIARGVAGATAPATAVFVGALVATLVAGVLRLHLWFTERHYPDEWPEQQRRAAVWIRAADLAFVAALAGSGAAVLAAEAALAAVLIASAAAVLVAAVIIEPATTRAAFKDR